MRRKSTIAWCSTSAPRRTFAGRSISGSSTPRLNQLTSPPEENAAVAGAGHDQAAQRRPVGEPGRGDAELADQLRAHRVERVGAVEGQGPDLAVDLDRERLQLGRGRNRCGAHRLRSCVACLAAGANRTLEPWSRVDRAAQAPAGSAGRLPVRRPRTGRSSTSARRRSIRKRVAAISPASIRAARDDRPDRLDRLPRHRERGRGAARRAAVHQAPPAAVQHPAARRQVVSVHRDQPRRGVPARLLHPRAPPLRPDLLRPVLVGEARARDARPARAAVPVPHLRGPRARPPLRRSLPRLLHQALRGALRRLRRPRGVPARDRRDRRLPLGPLPRRRARPRAQDGRGGRRRGVRARRRLPRPARSGALADGAAQRRRRVARRRRPGRGRARGRRGQRAGVPGPRRRCSPSATASTSPTSPRPTRRR